MRAILTAICATILCGVLWSGELLSQEPAKPDTAKTATWSDGQAKSEATAGAGASRRTLSIVEARRLGITVRSVRKCCEELKASGDITADTSHAEIAALVADRLGNQNKAAWGNAAALDLDAILAFIERLLPLILKLIDLFTCLPMPIEQTVSLAMSGSPFASQPLAFHLSA